MGVDIPWVGEVNTPWVGVDIPWVVGFDIPWLGSIYHG
jgi:hypothetical protein